MNFGLRDLAASVAARTPRIVVVSAPVGYRKGEVLRALAPYVGRLTVCDVSLRRDAADLARPVLDAVLARDPLRATRSAAARLGQRQDSAGTSREALRREWQTAESPELFAIRDPEDALASPGGADLFAELVGGLNPARILAVVTRSPLPPALLQVLPNERTVMLGRDDLVLDRDAAATLARHAGIDEERGQELHAAAGGWPLLTRLLIGLARDPQIDDAIQTLPPVDLLSFSAHRTIVGLAEVVRRALVVASLRHGADYATLSRVLGDECDDLCFARLSALPFVIRDGHQAIVHPDITALLEVRFKPLVRTLYERTLYVLTGDGKYVEAARVALVSGDELRAAAIIDAAPPYTAVPVPLGEYERIITRLDRALLTRFPNLWIATIPYRTFAVDRETFVREAETVYYCLPTSTSADQRAAALMMLANAYDNAGRIDESDRLIEEALTADAFRQPSTRASLLNFAASIRGMEGRFTLARELAAQAAAISRDEFGESQTLHYIDAHEAGYRGRSDRVVVIIDELMRRRTDDEMPLYVAYCAMNGAFFSWVNGDDVAFERYLSAMEDAIIPGLERGFAPMIDAARGRSIQVDDGYPWPALAAIAQLYRVGRSAGREEALNAARTAARFADLRRDPYLQILAHAALFVLDGTGREREGALLASLVESFESPEMKAAIEALSRGETPGILTAFVRRRIVGENADRAPRLVVELLAGTLTRDGSAVRLTDKEFELLAFLGAMPGPASRDRIGEALWDHLDPEEWPNNLKVTLSRLRAKLALRDAVLHDGGRYRLSPAIDVDLRSAEAAVRTCAQGELNDALRATLRDVVSTYRFTDGRYDRYSWSQPLVARLHDLACRAGIALANDALLHGCLDDAAEFSANVSAIDPFNEAACEVVVRVHLGQGDVDAARREFRRYSAALSQELGAAPSRHLAELLRNSA